MFQIIGERGGSLLNWSSRLKIVIETAQGSFKFSIHQSYYIDHHLTWMKCILYLYRVRILAYRLQTSNGSSWCQNNKYTFGRTFPCETRRFWPFKIFPNWRWNSCVNRCCWYTWISWSWVSINYHTNFCSDLFSFSIWRKKYLSFHVDIIEQIGWMRRVMYIALGLYYWKLSQVGLWFNKHEKNHI